MPILGQCVVSQAHQLKRTTDTSTTNIPCLLPR